VDLNTVVTLTLISGNEKLHCLDGGSDLVVRKCGCASHEEPAPQVAEGSVGRCWV